jgi:hypothetical protein
MSKPWDKLRTPANPPPMEPGYWYTSRGSRVEWSRSAGPSDAIICINNKNISVSASADGSVNALSIREIGEFFIELSNQLEPQ